MRLRTRSANILLPGSSEARESISQGLAALNKLGQARMARAGKTAMTRYQGDYAGYVREILGGNPWSKQVAIFDSVLRYPRTIVVASFATGKTWAGGGVANAFYDIHA